MLTSRRGPSGTAWIEAGHGPPLVFLHGLGGTSGSWNPQLEYFAANHRCVAWDMPGYGESAPVSPGPLNYDSIAGRLVAFLDDAEIEAADLVGLSFGGMHALHTALRHPTRVNRLVLANTSPAFGIDGTDPTEWKRSRLEAIDAGETPASIGPRVLDAIAGTPLDPAIRADLIAAFARIGVDGFRAAVECLPHNDVRDQLPTIRHPSLVIAGELDAETPISYAELLAAGLPNAQLEVLAGIGHLSPSEDPSRFNGIVAEFLGG